VYVSMGLGTRQILNILCIYANFLHNLGNWLIGSFCGFRTFMVDFVDFDF